MTVRQIGNVFVLSALRGGLLGGLQGPFLALKLAFFTIHLYNPSFETQMNPTQWDYNFPIF